VADMQTILRLLRGLQELDQELFRVKEELRRLPEERTRRRQKIDGDKERQSQLDRRLLDLRMRIKEIEDMTTMQRQRIRKLETEAANSRADTALIVAYQHEIRTLKRHISEADEEGVLLVEESETVQAERDRLAAAIEVQEKDFDEFAANVEREMQEALLRRRSLEQERRDKLSGVNSPTVLDQYEKLLDAREGQAVALLDGRICQGCFVTVPNNIYVRLARAVELVPCPSCGRILYLPEL
jgi:predicted  nucleic acid-binding Zn-ribbon protein